MNKKTIALLIVVGVLICLEVWLMVATDAGRLMSRYQTIAFLAIIGLVTGLLFYEFGPGKNDEFRWRVFGVRLGGAAAIGAALVGLLWHLTQPPPNNCRVVPLESADCVSNVRVISVTPGAQAEVLLNRKEALVRFPADGSADLVTFTTRCIREDGNSRVTKYTINRSDMCSKPGGGTP